MKDATPQCPGAAVAARPAVSILVPLFNEEESIGPLWQAIRVAMDEARLDYELLLVDDGSSDGTWNICCALASHEPRIRAIRFRRNFGQTPAMAAGIEHARGQVIVTMDGDLQNDPRDIPALVARLDEGYDLVVGWRYDRKDRMISRKIPSRIANWLIGKVTGIPIKDNGCSLKAYRAALIKSVPLYSEMHRFIPAMARMSGARIAEMKVQHHPRRFGTSKYGISRTWRVLLDLVGIKTLSAAVQAPMRWFARIAVPFFLAGTGFLFAAAGASHTVVFFGTGLLLIATAILMFFSGVLTELVLKTSEVRPGRVGALSFRKSGEGR